MRGDDRGQGRWSRHGNEAITVRMEGLRDRLRETSMSDLSRDELLRLADDLVDILDRNLTRNSMPAGSSVFVEATHFRRYDQSAAPTARRHDNAPT